MKKTIDKVLLFVLGALFAPAVAAFFPEYATFIENHRWLGIGTVVAFLIVLVWYWRVCEKQDQRDVKTVISDVETLLHVPKRCLDDTNVTRIENAPDLSSLLNCKDDVVSRVMNKKQRIDLPKDSCILQVSFIPVDKEGNTILWKRMPKNHIMKSGTGSVLISFSPYARKFSDMFVEDWTCMDSATRSTLDSIGITGTDLRDIYSREVPNVSIGRFDAVGAYWLPRQKDERGRYNAPAYCFWVYAVKYDVDFRDSRVLDSIFGRKLPNGRFVYLKKDNDRKLSVLPLKSLQSYMESGQLALGKMDACVANNYADFLK